MSKSREEFIEWWQSRHYDDADVEVKKAAWCAWQAARESEGGEAVSHDWVDCPICGEPDMRQTTHDDREHTLIHCCNSNCLSNGGTNASAITHPSASVPEGYILIEKGITPTHVLEAGLECFRLLNQSGIADDRTLVLSVFQDMLLAAANPPEQESE